jgi:hypothetical protein
MQKLIQTGKVEAFDLIKSICYQTAKRAIGTTKAAPRYYNKIAKRRGGFDARVRKRTRKNGKPMQWAFGQAQHDGQKYKYGVIAKGSRGFGLIPSKWRGSKMYVATRGYAKTVWIGALRALTRKYGRNKHMIGTGTNESVNGTTAKRYGDGNVKKGHVSVYGEISNATAPISYLNGRDNLATKAVNQVRYFLAKVLIPEAEAGFEKTWNKKGV